MPIFFAIIKSLLQNNGIYSEMTLIDLPLKIVKHNSRGNIYVNGDISFEKSKDEKRRYRTEEAIRTDDIMKTKPS